MLYTLDQVATLINVSIDNLKAEKLWYEGRSVGRKPGWLLRAVNINAPGQYPDWRIQEDELNRWLRYKGFVLT